MNNVDQVVLASAVVHMLPDLIRESLLNDSYFCTQNGIVLAEQLTVGHNDLIIMKPDWFAAVKNLLSSHDNFSILKDTNHREWKLVTSLENGVKKIQVSGNNRILYLPFPTALSHNQTERLNGFEQQIEGVHLPIKDAEYWRSILVTRPLSDDEFRLFDEDCANTPIAISQLIEAGALAGNCDISILVPPSESYFLRLVGDCGTSRTITDYTEHGLADHFKHLMAWRRLDGFLLALPLFAHAFDTSLVETTLLSDDEIGEAYKWLASYGDMISRIGAIEVGLAIIDQRPKIKPFLIEIIKEIINDDVNNDASRFNFLSSLIILVDGKLAHTKIFGDRPPFWRRLAAIAQASLIERALLHAKVDIARFSEKILQNNASIFFMQSFVDMRHEPRWQPDYNSAKQLRVITLSRLIATANQNANKIETGELHDLLFGETGFCIQPPFTVLDCFIPGPLAGGLEPQQDAPPEIIELIENQLNAAVLEVNSFNSLVNSALIFRLNSHQIELVGKALRTAKFQIKHVTSKDQLTSILYGLATVAAITRNTNLAEDVIILTQNFGQLPGVGVLPENAMAIGLIAAAAFPELADWSRFIGNWMTSLAFSPLNKEEALRLQVFCKQICHIVPELWHTCGKAEAALEARLT